MSEWQRIGEVPVDSGRLVLVDPMNTDDVAEQGCSGRPTATGCRH